MALHMKKLLGKREKTILKILEKKKGVIVKTERIHFLKNAK